MKALAAVALGLVAGVAAAAFIAGRGPFRRADDASRPAAPVLSAPAAPGVAAPSGAPPRDAPSPDEIAIGELLRANAALEADPALAEEYRDVNTRYFNGALPAVTVRWEPRLAGIGPLIADGFQLEGATDGDRLILINPVVRSDEAALRRVLCHEMVHVAVRNHADGHGPVFQTFLRQLSEKGAFTGVVATDEEKAALRASLDAQSAALTRESDALVEARAEIDAGDAALRAAVDDLNARTAAANQRQAGWPSDAERDAVTRRQGGLESRVEEYNARVQRHNAAIAELNRGVERYNLMIVYPDGLDRERYRRRLPIATADR
jgi:hypothetical protein